jgi:hypothetical protein
VEEEGSGDTAVYAFGSEFFTNEVEWLDHNQNQYKAVFKVYEEYLEPSTKYSRR